MWMPTVQRMQGYLSPTRNKHDQRHRHQPAPPHGPQRSTSRAQLIQSPTARVAQLRHHSFCCSGSISQHSGQLSPAAILHIPSATRSMEGCEGARLLRIVSSPTSFVRAGRSCWPSQHRSRVRRRSPPRSRSPVASRAEDEGYRVQRSRALIWIKGGACFPYGCRPRGVKVFRSVLPARKSHQGLIVRTL